MSRLKKIIVVGLILIAFASGLSTGMAAGAAPTDKEIQVLERATWSLTCYINEVDCSNIPKPLVVYADIPPEQDTWGWHIPGEAYIVLDTQIRGTHFSVTILSHEYTHYIQFIQRKFQGERDPKQVTCDTEREATVVGYVASVAAGIDNDPRVPTWDDVKAQYGCEK